MELRVLVNSQEAIQLHMQDKDFQWFAKLRILMRIVSCSTSEANSLAVAITSSKSQQITLTYSLLPLMLSHQKVSSLSYLRRKLKTFLRNSKTIMSRWRHPYKSWINVLFSWIPNSSNRDALEQHQLTLEEDLNCLKKRDNLRMHRQVKNKRSRIFRLKMRVSKRRSNNNKR